MTTMLEIRVVEQGAGWWSARIVQRNAHPHWRVLQRSFKTSQEATDWVCDITKAGKAKAWETS